MSKRPTKQAYNELEIAYSFFNRKLFRRELPNCLITMQRSRNAYGYFAASSFENKSGEKIDEIAMNPNHFSRSVKDVLSTLVHEMVHLWQEHNGKPGRRRYHNKQWAKKMEDVGLVPSDTGAPGGKKIGERMTHYIQKNGPFDRAADVLLKKDFLISWKDSFGSESSLNVRAEKSKVKYTCLECEINAWAKPGIHLVCGKCKEDLLEVI